MTSTALATLTSKLAAKLDMGTDGRELVETLKQTAFKGEVTDAQMTALLVVANQYGLNPWTKEIYAFPDKNNGIVPVVGVDGWSRIINNNPDFDGMDFNMSEKMVRMPGAKCDAPEWMECTIYRKSRGKPIIVREYMDEVYREPFKGKYGDVIGPWQTHPKRFLRHKTMIQCSRIAFGFGGIYDPDEAERIVESSDGYHPKEKDMGAAEVVNELPPYPEQDFAKNLDAWRSAIEQERITADKVIARASSKYKLTDAQVAAIAALERPANVDEDGVIATDDFTAAYEREESHA